MVLILKTKSVYEVFHEYSRLFFQKYGHYCEVMFITASELMEDIFSTWCESWALDMERSNESMTVRSAVRGDGKGILEAGGKELQL